MTALLFPIQGWFERYFSCRIAFLRIFEFSGGAARSRCASLRPARQQECRAGEPHAVGPEFFAVADTPDRRAR